MRRVVCESDPYQREWYEPETFVERIAWSLCAADQTADGGYLNDDELEALEILLRKMAAMCGSDKGEASWLGVPLATVETKVRRLKHLAMMERSRRTDNDPLFQAHLTRAYWTDYMGKAKSVWSIICEHPDIAAVVTLQPKGTEHGQS